MKRVIGSVALAGCLAVGIAGPARADGDGDGTLGSADGRSVTMEASTSGDGNSAGAGAAGGSATGAGDGAVAYAVAPAPLGAWGMCREDETVSAVGLCWRPDLPAEADGPDATAIDFPALVRREFQRLTIAPSPLSIQPDAPKAVVDVPVIAYTNGAPQTFEITLLGYPITIETRPTRFAWDFGDGATLTTTDPGAPYPHQGIEHAYSVLGTHHITLTTTWAGRFRVAGATDWVAITGTATTTAASHDFEIYGVTVHLVPGG